MEEWERQVLVAFRVPNHRADCPACQTSFTRAQGIAALMSRPSRRGRPEPAEEASSVYPNSPVSRQVREKVLQICPMTLAHRIDRFPWGLLAMN